MCLCEGVFMPAQETGEWWDTKVHWCSCSECLYSTKQWSPGSNLPPLLLKLTMLLFSNFELLKLLLSVINASWSIKQMYFLHNTIIISTMSWIPLTDFLFWPNTVNNDTATWGEKYVNHSNYTDTYGNTKSQTAITNLHAQTSTDHKPCINCLCHMLLYNNDTGDCNIYINIISQICFSLMCIYFLELYLICWI